MEKLVFIAILLISIISSAEIQPEQYLVKITSFPCFTKLPVYEGTGLIFKKDKKVSVITSEHVLMTGSLNDICYLAESKTIGVQKLKLKRNDFLFGLAELDFVTSIDVNNLPDTSMKTSEDKSKPLLALGYPKGSQTLHALEGGSILTYKSRRAFIPAYEGMIEAIGLPVEYGMSGGVLLSQEGKNFEFVGLMTHQYLKRESSKKSQVVRMGEKSQVQNTDIVIGIKASDIITWQQSLVSEQPYEWMRSQEVNGFSEIIYGPLSMSQIVFSSDQLAMGGADGSGIGGGESQTDLKKGELIGLELKLNKKYLYQNVKLKNPLFKKWYQWLLRGETLTIVQLMRDEESRTYAINSFDQFVTLWQRDEYKPLVFRGNISDFDSKHGLLIKKLRSVQKKIKELCLQVNSSELNLWLSLLSEKIFLIENFQLHVTDLKKFNSKFSSRVWDELYMDYFDEAIELEFLLESILEI